ncbi:MAG TPA: phosphopyruvate hydratase [Mycobacteriales bacterium]|nr:phosphopyruvate hydratase [Mycobacteriales bacterium]
MKTDIAEIAAWEALDSRGRPTVACRVRLEGGAVGRAIVPSGASTGGHEAIERRDGGERYSGYGVRGAVTALIEELAPAVHGMDAVDYRRVDARLEEVDGTAALERIGANAVLAVSLAGCLAAGAATGRPLWRFLTEQVQTPAPPRLPLPMINIISGGAHAGRALDVQDILAVPVAATSFAEAIELTARVRAATAVLLERAGGAAALVADEGGLAAALGSNAAALDLITDGISAAGLQPGEDVAVALDVAANQFLDNTGDYHLASEDTTLTPAEWLETVRQWCDRYPLISIEDVLAEDDWAGWQEAGRILPPDRQLLGDDLFATNAGRLQRGITESVANAVLVKPNQAGTLSRAQEVLEAAHAAGYATVVSARSGDTEDSWLADLAVGWRAGQVKVGSLTRSERTAKWNRLLEIEHDTPELPLAGRNSLGRRISL